MKLARRTLMLTAAASVARAAEPTTVICPLTVAPTVLIPGVSDAFATRLVGGKIYSGLMRWDAAGVLQPDLAESVEVSADGLTYRFHLRKDVTWHDSGGFDSSDVAFSLTQFHRALQPRRRLERLMVETPDALTLVVGLPAPEQGFLASLDALSLPIVPRHIHDRPGWGLNPLEVTPVGTGPFRVESWLRLVRFEWFAGAKPALAVIGFPIVPDGIARLALVDSGAVVLLVGDAVDPAAIVRLRSSATLAVEAEYPRAARTIAGLRLNPAVVPLDKSEVRVALAAAINRHAALREGWAGQGRVAIGPIIDGTGEILPEFNPRAASAALNAAGLRPDEAGIRGRLTYLHPANAPWSSLFPPLRASLGQVGVELVAEAVSAVEWISRLAAGKYQITGFSVDQPGDPAADLAAYASMLPDLAPLALPDAQAQALLVRKMPAIWLVEPAISVVRDKRLNLPGGVLGSFAGAMV